MRTATFLLLFVACCSATVRAQDSPPNKWKSADGRELTAEFVRLTDDSVVLRLSDGREATVGLSSLSLESHLQAIKLANPAAFSKPLPKAEIKEEIKVEIPELNLSVDEMLRSPFPSNPTIEQFLDILKREHAAGNYFVDWHAIPPKMQSDIEDLIVRSVEVIGPTTVNQIRILLGDLNTIVQDKKEFILANPAVASQPQLVAQLDKHWPLIASVVGAFTQADLWSADNFQKGKIVPWLANFSATVTPYSMAALETAKGELPFLDIEIPDPTAFEYRIVSQSAGTAEVEVTMGGMPPEQMHYQKVGNIWLVPKQMNEMRKGVDTAMEQLAKGAGPELTMVRTGLAAVIAAVGSLARSSTQQEFDQAVDSLMVMAQSMAPNMGGPPGGPGGPGRGAPGFGGPGGRSGGPGMGPGMGPGAGPGGRSGGPGMGIGPGGDSGGRRGGGPGPNSS